AGRPTEAIKQTDEDGTAERIGRELAEERPDLSRAEAEKLVEELLRLGQLYERQQGKQPAVNLNSTTDPLTGQEQK
ncbi:hypothetical protein EG19_01135, partial [Thermoanaerobaculum aquaticum]